MCRYHFSSDFYKIIATFLSRIFEYNTRFYFTFIIIVQEIKHYNVADFELLFIHLLIYYYAKLPLYFDQSIHIYINPFAPDGTLQYLEANSFHSCIDH